MGRGMVGKPVILTVGVVLAVLAVFGVLLVNNSSTHRVYNSIGLSKPSEPLNVKLLDSSYSKVSRPVEYYELSNGTVVRITDKNPFPFTVKVTVKTETPIIGEIYVYRLEFYNSTSEVIRLFREFGASQSGLLYNRVTKTYLYSDGSVRLEYSPVNGFFRIVFVNNNPSTAQARAITDAILGGYPGILRFKPEYRPTMNVNGVNAGYAMVYTGYINGIPTPFKVLVILGNDNSTVKEIQGIVVKKIMVLGKYRVIPVNALPKLISERVRGEIVSNDWYISKLGFTRLTIDNVNLTYMMIAGQNLLVPVYKFTGDWILDYANLNYHGDLMGMIVAVYNK